MTESECLSEFRFGKRDILMRESCFPCKVYFLYIKDIWFALPKYVQINLSQFTYEFARSASSAVVILQSKINSFVEFSINIARLEKKGTIPWFRRTRKCKGLQKSLKTVDLYLPKLVDCRTTWFYFVWRRRRHHDGRRQKTATTTTNKVEFTSSSVLSDEIYWSRLRSTL